MANSLKHSKKYTATHKWCPRCEEWLPHERFGKSKKPSHGLAAYCKGCAWAKRRETESPGARERRLRRARERTARPESIALDKDRDLRALYGITLDDYMTFYFDQDKRCGVCGEEAAPDKFHVDHDHKTGEVRGLLCRHCNLGLGRLGDDEAGVARALAYLRGGKYSPREMAESLGDMPYRVVNWLYQTRDEEREADLAVIRAAVLGQGPEPKLKFEEA